MDGPPPMWAGMVWIGTRGPLTAEGQVTSQSPSLSSLKASAERRNDSLKLSGSAAGSLWKRSCGSFVQADEGNLPEAQLSLIVNFEDFVVRFNRTTQRRMK